MNAPVKTQVLYAFPTREEERAAKFETDSYGKFYRIRSMWVRQRERQEVWAAALRMVEHLKQTEQDTVFLKLLEEKRAGVIPCTLHPMTMDNRFFPGEPDLPHDVVTAEMVEEALDLTGWVVGSRRDRSRFWNYVEMNLRGHTPTDLLETHDCEKQFSLQRSLLEAWERKWNRDLSNLVMSKETEESDRELSLIYCGHAQGVESYNSLGRANIRRYAALYWKANHSLNSWCSVVVRKGTKAVYLGFPREAEPGEQPRIGTRPLSHWMDYGVESIAQFPFPTTPRTRYRAPRKLPETPLNVGKEPDYMDEFVEHQLFGLAQGVLPRWPSSQLPLLQLIEERLYNKRQRRSDERRFHKPSEGQCIVPQVELVEQEILGRVFTQGSPARRAVFWLYMCALSMGMKDFCRTSRIAWEYSPSRTNSFTVIKVASQLVAEGANPFHMSKLIACGRGGAAAPLPPEDPQVLANPTEYAELRMLADYGMLGFEV